MGGDAGGGSGRPAVSGGCRTKFQLEKKSPIVQLPRVCVFLAGSSEADPEAAAPSPARPGCPRGYPPQAGEGQGPAGPARWRGAGGGWGGARDDSPTLGFLLSASPPPLSAHRRPLLRPGVARCRPFTQEEELEVRSGRRPLQRASCRRSRWGQQGQPAGGTGCSRRSRRALRSEQTSGGAGGARGRAGVRNPPPPPPAHFRPQRGGWRGAARVPYRLETPPAAIGARPPCAPSERRASSSPRASCWGALVYATPGRSAYAAARGLKG